VVPPEETARAFEIDARLGTLMDDAAVGGFDPHGAPFENAAVTPARIGGENNTLLIGRDAGHEVIKPASLELRPDCETTCADLHHQLR
jgi:hypothetical protein